MGIRAGRCDKFADYLDLEHLLAAIKASMQINPELNSAVTISTF
jgi:hypothetical protein